jgi:hypothetical protein
MEFARMTTDAAIPCGFVSLCGFLCQFQSDIEWEKFLAGLIMIDEFCSISMISGRRNSR